MITRRCWRVCVICGHRWQFREAPGTWRCCRCGNDWFESTAVLRAKGQEVTERTPDADERWSRLKPHP